MNSRKVMMLITVLSLLIVVVVVFIVHSGKDDETEGIPITPDSVAIGSWSTDASGAAAGSGSEKTMDDVTLTLTEEGHADGTFGKYEFEGTWQQVSKFEIRLINNKGKSVYKAVIDPEDEDTERPAMDLAAKDVTDSMTWTLYKK